MSKSASERALKAKWIQVSGAHKRSSVIENDTCMQAFVFCVNKSSLTSTRV